MPDSPFLDARAPLPAPAEARWIWAVVTQSSPLRIKMDGDLVALGITPDDLGGGTRAVGERVYCQILNRRLVVMGPDALPSRLKTSNWIGTVVNPDSLTENGFYAAYQWAGSLSGNSVGTLLVEQYSPDWIIQTFTTVNATPTRWQRARHSGTTWTAWSRFAMDSDLALKRNEIGPVITTSAEFDLVRRGTAFIHSDAQAATMTNLPADSFGVKRSGMLEMDVAPNSAFYYQRYSTYTGQVYTRMWYSGTGWTPWYERSVARTNWTPLSLVNGWTNYPGWAPAQYMKRDGIVWVQGLIRDGSLTAGLSCATLPVGYRPGGTLILPTQTGQAFATFDVQGDGQIILRSVPNNSFYSINCSFPAEN